MSCSPRHFLDLARGLVSLANSHAAPSRPEIAYRAAVRNAYLAARHLAATPPSSADGALAAFTEQVCGELQGLAEAAEFDLAHEVTLDHAMHAIDRAVALQQRLEAA